MALSYVQYHEESMRVGDVDPSYQMLRYVCDRFELTMEQRYWLAFLYATCYCGATVFYIYNEFPDFENVDLNRLQRWWNENKSRLIFQTDRRWVRSNNDFVPMVASYQNFIPSGLSQEDYWRCLRSDVPELNYEIAFEEAGKIRNMGRFSLFLYLEAVHVVTGYPMRPPSMKMADADSCRNGLAEAIGHPEFNTHRTKRRPTRFELDQLQREFDQLVQFLTQKDRSNNVWNIETTLCAYRKYLLGKRYVGYYLDRQRDEIEKMRARVPDGVDWSVLDQYRAETYDHRYLIEFRC